jgi:predicted aspartyl protease
MMPVMRRALALGLVVLFGLAAAPSPALAQFYRWLDEHGNAHYAEGIDNVPQRYRTTAVPLGMRNTAAPAVSTPMPGAAPTRAGATEIRVVPGRHIVVDARINDGPTVKLILDTGAGGTLISPRALAASGVSLTRGTRTGRTRGVAKDVEVEVMQVVIDSLDVGGARVGRMVVSSYDMDMTEVEGLLGQDFLGHFNVTIDSNEGVVRLVKK